MFLEIGQLVPGDFGNFRKVSVLSRCFRIWSAGSGRFRKFSEGFRVFTLFFKLVSWFRKISEKSEGFHVIPLFFKLVSGFSVAKGWFQRYPIVFKLVNGFQVDFHDIPLFFKLVNGFRLLLMLSHCFSWWSTVFGCFPYAFPLFSKLGAVATAIVSCEKPPRQQQQRFGWYLEVQLVSCKREGWLGGGNMSCWRARSVKMTWFMLSPPEINIEK